LRKAIFNSLGAGACFCIWGFRRGLNQAIFAGQKGSGTTPRTRIPPGNHPIGGDTYNTIREKKTLQKRGKKRRSMLGFMVGDSGSTLKVG